MMLESCSTLKEISKSIFGLVIVTILRIGPKSNLPLWLVAYSEAPSRTTLASIDATNANSGPAYRVE